MQILFEVSCSELPHPHWLGVTVDLQEVVAMLQSCSITQIRMWNRVHVLRLLVPQHSTVVGRRVPAEGEALEREQLWPGGREVRRGQCTEAITPSRGQLLLPRCGGSDDTAGLLPLGHGSAQHRPWRATGQTHRSLWQTVLATGREHCTGRTLVMAWCTSIMDRFAFETFETREK